MKIAPEYSQPVVHVLDASRVVGVVSALLDPARRATLDAENREAPGAAARAVRRARAQAAAAARGRAREPRARRVRRARDAGVHRARASSSRRSRRCAPYIDWQFFFHAWELKGKFPAILEQPARARALRRRAGAARRDRRATGCSRARGVYGFWPASSDGDDIVVHDDNGTRFCFLRQQSAYGDSRPNRSLADYVAPATATTSARSRSPPASALDELAARFEAEHDDYRSIMAKALADRLAEAFAEYLHEVARREWYEPGEQAPPERLIAERFRGIRPAFGYPACPDHSEKGKLFELLGAERRRHRADRELAMTAGRERQRHLPRAPAGALLLRRPPRAATRSRTTPRARACRVAEVERWLRPNLGYEPVRADPEQVTA